MTRIRKIAFAATALALGIGLTACSSSLTSGKSASSGSSDGVIKLGMLTPLTGSSAAIGPYMRDGAQMAVDEINAKGGVNGRKLSLTVEDEACDPKTAAAGAAKLVSDGVNVSVGGYCSSATLPTLSIFNKAGIPMIIPAANSADLVAQNLPNVFLINGTGVQQSRTASDFIKAQGAKGVALVDDNTSYSTDLTKRTGADLAQMNVPVATHQSVTAGESDYSGAVNAIMGSKADFVYWTGYYQEGGLIIKQLKAAGYQGKIMVADGSVDAKLIQIAGQQDAQGVYATMTETAQTMKGGQSWIADYKKKFGADPGPYSTQAYDAVRVAAQAIGDAGSTNGQAVEAALMKIDGFSLFSGPLKFTPDHTLSVGGFSVLVVQGSDFALAG